jgi:DNA polymerase-3 subunit epsilon
MKLVDEPVLFLDCQTTGATPKAGHLLELGWALGSGIGQPVTVSRLIRLPDNEAPPVRIQRLTGITAGDMEGAHDTPQVVAELLTQMTAHSANLRFAVAHYAQFEQAFVNHLFAELNQSTPFSFFCTCQIAKRLYPDLPSRAIRALGGYFGLTLSEMKRSACHVDATYHIWQRLVQDLARIGIEDGDALSEFLKTPLPSRARVRTSPYAIPMERLKRLDLPAKPGIYRMLNQNGQILYIGKATSLKSRVNSYFRGRNGKDSKTKELISQIFDIAVDVVQTPLEAALLECDLIKQHDPPYNRALRQRGRTLTFYSHDFKSASDMQSKEHCYGPFVSDSFKPVLDLLRALQDGAYPAALFWNLVPEDIIAEGFKLLLGEGPLSRLTVEELSGRRLLAIGMILWREELRQIRAAQLAESELLAQNAKEDATEIATEDDAEDIEEELEIVVAKELDQFDVVDMVYSLLSRSARMYLQCKKLAPLLDAEISFVDGGKARTLVFSGGRQITESEAVMPLSSYCVSSYSVSSYPWAGLQIDTYDRIRVLQTELARVAARGNPVSITVAEPVSSAEPASPVEPASTVLSI